MYYHQGNTIRKLIEMMAVFLVMFAIDAATAVDLAEFQPSPFIIILLLFSIRYGWKMGLLTLLFTFLYYFVSKLQAGEDIVLLFYHIVENKWLFLYFLIVAIAGTASATARERYEDLHFVNEEMKADLISVKQAVEQLSETNGILEDRLLQSETSINSVYQMMRALDQDNLELLTNEAVNILSSYFQAETFGIYHVDSSRRAFRIKVRVGSVESLPQTIFVDDAVHFYMRMFHEKKIVVKRPSDSANAPVLAGPIIIGGEIRQILIIRKIDFYHLTESNIQLLYLLLQIISESSERAAARALVLNRRKIYPDTKIYYKKYFDEYVEIEKQRFKEFNQPYSTFELTIGQWNQETLLHANRILQRYLREVDKVGFDASENKLYILLPGTEQQYVGKLQNRIFEKLEKEGIANGV